MTTAAYPQASDFASDPEGVLVAVGELQQAITEIRRIRGEMEIPLKTEMAANVADAGLAARLARPTIAPCGIWPGSA